MAMVAIAPGMFLAHKVVPSNGSTAMSTRGPCPVPTFSPMNSIGASSRSPSPITIVRAIAAMGPAARVSLHDRFKRDVLVRQMLRNGREGAGPVERKQANIVAAFMALHRRLTALGEAAHRASKRRRTRAAGDVAEIGDHR